MTDTRLFPDGDTMLRAITAYWRVDIHDPGWLGEILPARPSLTCAHFFASSAGIIRPLAKARSSKSSTESSWQNGGRVYDGQVESDL